MMKKNLVYLLITLIFNSLSAQKIVKLEKTKFWIYGGEIHRVENFFSKHVAQRNIDIWLPNNYNENKKYSVIYMHDGGALFGKRTSQGVFGDKLKADEVATKLLAEKKSKEFIIVGIYNTGMTRWNEYYPKKSFKYLDQSFKDSLEILYDKGANYSKMMADDYLRFIVEELKPFIDKEFSVYNNVEETYIAGSSMGGLISMYATFEYPEIFSGAACISTHWLGSSRNKNGEYDRRFPFSIFDYMQDNIPDSTNHRFWFDYGDAQGDLDSYYVDYAPYLDSIFNKNGYDSKKFKNIRYFGEKHNEKSWTKRLDEIFEFLLKP